MTITVTPVPAFTPPRNQIDVSVAVGSIMSAVTVNRNDSTGRIPLRTQPSAGFDSRTVYDYECPYGESVTYDWNVEYTDPTAYVTVFNETWASLASWTVTSGGWAVSGGKVHNTSAPSYLTRTVTLGKYRFTFTGVVDTTPGGGAIALIGAGLTLSITLDGSGNLRFAAPGFSSASTIVAASPFTVDFNAASVTVSGTGGTITLPIDMSVSTIRLGGSAAPTTLTVDDIKMQSYPAPTLLAQTSSPVTLAPDAGWLVHPGTPGLSFPLQLSAGANPRAASIRSIAPVTNPSNATIHRILGTGTGVATTNGPRDDDETAMTISIHTHEEELALKALLLDQTAILVNIAPDKGVDFAYGFYQIGDASSARLGQAPNMPFRSYVLPMVRVGSPVVSVQSSGWSWAVLAAEFATWADVKAAFATWADVASNNRL